MGSVDGVTKWVGLSLRYSPYGGASSARALTDCTGSPVTCDVVAR